jgi:lipopolysaccharide/colanic/teichoic acid biosynthesis glycosyltransferase
MYIDAEERLALLEAQNEADGPVFKIRRDPRITRVGRVIRKLSIDELPQLWNVVRGEMSLVGPRPALPREVICYTPEQVRRLDALPGITGLQQVSGRSNLDFERWVALDLQYIEQQSIWQDIKILLLTIPTVITGRGAY